MTAVPRDPAFWKRFSVAAHMAEDMEVQKTGYSSSSSSTRPSLKHQDSWLERQQHKNRRNKVVLWVYGLSVAALVAVMVLIIVWVSQHGFFLHGEEVTFP
ncbi:MAG: hypothetical protein LQ340_000554 [Diploschistes diacapsis]|nr:MAG: hypothetical protein LQ340_000554 [Diploschistes diacapsis]